MRIALVRPLYETPVYDPETQEALGIETLAGLLRAQGHAVLELDAMLGMESEEAIALRASRFRPDVIGFSAMSEGNLESIRRLIGRVEGSSSKRPVVLVGGNLPSTQPCQTLQSLPEHSICVSFEGERPLLDLLARLERNLPIDGVPGTAHTGADGTTHQVPPAAPVEDLDALPYAERGFAGVLVERGRTLNIQGSRGCCGACAYCCAPSFPHSPGRPWRGRAPESIADEMVCLNQVFGARTFNFVDDDFLGPAGEAGLRAERLNRALASRGLRVSFGIQVRPESLSLQTIRLLTEAGLAYAFVGFENDDPVVLKRWGRNQDNSRTWEAVDSLRSHGVEVQVGCITYHEYVTIEAVERLAMLLVSQGALNYRTATNRLHALPGSRIYADYLDKGSISEHESGGFTTRIACSAAENLHETLLLALQPIRPCWVHGVTLLPHLVTRHRVEAESGVARTDSSLRSLRSILSELDEAVEKTLFALINGVQRDESLIDVAVRLRRQNLSVAEAAAKQLAAGGLAESYEHMRHVIRSESGL